MSKLILCLVATLFVMSCNTTTKTKSDKVEQQDSITAVDTLTQIVAQDSVKLDSVQQK